MADICQPRVRKKYLMSFLPQLGSNMTKEVLGTTRRRLKKTSGRPAILKAAHINGRTTAC